MTLLDWRVYPTWARRGFLFDLHESHALRDGRMIQACWQEPLPVPEKVRQQRIGSLQALLEEVPELGLLIDGTERRKIG
jgi:hypothetical protein